MTAAARMELAAVLDEFAIPQIVLTVDLSCVHHPSASALPRKRGPRDRCGAHCQLNDARPTTGTMFDQSRRYCHGCIAEPDHEGPCAFIGTCGRGRT